MVDRQIFELFDCYALMLWDYNFQSQRHPNFPHFRLGYVSYMLSHPRNYIAQLFYDQDNILNDARIKHIIKNCKPLFQNTYLELGLWHQM